MAATLGIATLETGVDLKGLDKGISQSKQKTEGFLSQVKTGFANKFGMSAADAAISAAKAVKEFADQSIEEFQTFEKSMSEVFTLMPGITQDAMGKMEDDVLAFSAQVGRQTDETIPALYQAISAGVPPENVFDFLQVASDAALGGVTDLETAVDGITSVTNAYGTEVLSAANASDVMFTAVKLGKTDFEQLSSSLFNVIPTAASLGISFEDVAAQLAVLTGQGVPTSVATTQLRQAFIEASKGGTKLSNAIQDLTGKSFTDLIADGHTSAEIFQALRRSMPEQEFKDLFGSVEALNAVLGVTGPNANKTAAAMLEMENASGATAAAAETMSQSYEHLQNETAAAKEQLMIMVGEGLVPGSRALEEFKRDTLLLVGALLQLNQAVDDASNHIADLVETGEDADVNADKLLDTWVSLDDFWGRSRFGRGKLQEDMQRVVVATTDLGGSFADVEARLKELNPEFDVSATGVIRLDGSMVGHINTLREMQAEQRDAAIAMQAASHDAVMLSQALDTTTADGLIPAEEAAEELTVTMMSAAEQYALNTARANDYREASLDYEVTAEDVKAAEIARTEAHKAAEQAQIDAAKAAAEHTAALGDYFNSALTATGETVSMERQLYDAANAAGAGATELAILAAATGEYSAAEIEAAFQAALMSENINILATAVAAGTITADEAVGALGRLKDGQTDAAGTAIQLEQDARNAAAAMDEVSGAAIDAATSLNSIPTNVNVNVHYSATGSVQPPDGYSSGVPGGSGYASGGWTGSGMDTDVAGLVHKNELVVPAPVLQSGPAGILDFANQHVPGGVGSGGNDNSRKISMINPRFYGVENVPNFLEQLEAIAP